MKKFRFKPILIIFLFILLCIMTMPKISYTLENESSEKLNDNGTNNEVKVKLNDEEIEKDKEIKCGEGTIKFDSISNKLILNNVTIKEDISKNVNDLITIEEGKLEIQIIGTNKINSESVDTMPFFIKNSEVTIKGTSEDNLILDSNADCIVTSEDKSLTIEGCNVYANSHKQGGIEANKINIKNANIYINSYIQAMFSVNDIVINESTIEATTLSEANTLTSYGSISITDSNISTKGISKSAIPSIYAEGNIDVNHSKLNAISHGMRGIFTDSNMNIRENSIVTSIGNSNEGIVVVGELNISNSRLIAKANPNNIMIPAIVTKHFNVDASEVIANGGLQLMDWYDEDATDMSCSIKPVDGTSYEFKVDENNWYGSNAVHFNQNIKSPFDKEIVFSLDDINWFGSYRYIYIGKYNPNVGNYYPSKPEPTKEEIIGKDRYETAALVADKVGNYETVVLVNADETMSDGLSASSLSGKYNAPILLVKQNKIPDVSMKRIQKAKKVYIIGGTNAISKEVEKQLSGKNITRIGGLDRYETSELIAKELGNYSKVFIVNGKNGEADAMSASSVAAKYSAPIILTNGKSSNYIKEENKEYYVIGGKNVVSDSIVEKYSARRIAGEDRYETNRKVISEFYSGSSKYYVANGNTLVDALTASILAQEKGVVLVNEKSDNSILEDKSTVQIGGFDFEI